MMTPKQAIQLAIESGEVTWMKDYAELGYSAPEQGILFANWNSKGHWSETTNSYAEDDNTMPRLAKIAEHLGYEIEWEDEWCSCGDCGRAIRTEANSYEWRASYWQSEDSLYCADCVKNDPRSYLESLEDCDDRALTFDLDLAEHGYTKLDQEFEHGWHPGQNDSPAIIARDLRKRGVKRFIFEVDNVGQFDMHFMVWVHEDELEKLDTAPVASSLPYDPATEMGKVLRGKPSDYYRTETRTITAREFIDGSWCKD